MNESEATPKAQEDHEFYFQDMIVFLVENRLFKVPARNFITESEVFETMFKLPQNPDVVADGLSNDQPLRLDGVKCEDFRQLLRVMYPSGIDKMETLTMEQWSSVLALSTRWDMTAIRAKAIKNVREALNRDGLDPHNLILFILGQTHRVDEWVMLATISLIKRQEPMGPNDAKIIGVENALKIASLREQHHRYGGIHDRNRTAQLFGLG